MQSSTSNQYTTTDTTSTTQLLEQSDFSTLVPIDFPDASQSSPVSTTSSAQPNDQAKGKWSRRLVITKQPPTEFYKDEGGKSNFISIEVSLVEFNSDGESDRSSDEEFVDIPLSVAPFFESGKRVEDPQIFRTIGNDVDGIVIKPTTRTAVIHFRLEKVSRRKDCQRFKIMIEPNREHCTANVDDLTPVFTNPIYVLSKRKIHHLSPSTDSSLSQKPSPVKYIKKDLEDMEERIGHRLEKMSAHIDRLHRQLLHQNNMISKFILSKDYGPSFENAGTRANFRPAFNPVSFFSAEQPSTSWSPAPRVPSQHYTSQSLEDHLRPPSSSDFHESDLSIPYPEF